VERDQLPRELKKMTAVRTRELRMEALDGELLVSATVIQREAHSDVYVQGGVWGSRTARTPRHEANRTRTTATTARSFVCRENVDAAISSSRSRMAVFFFG
jgi:hypothetical protein